MKSAGFFNRYRGEWTPPARARRETAAQAVYDRSENPAGMLGDKKLRSGWAPFLNFLSLTLKTLKILSALKKESGGLSWH